MKLSRRFIFYLLVMVVSLFVTLSAMAHDIQLKGSEPAAGSVLESSPPQVKIWFDEELQTGESTIGVFDGDDNRVDNGDGRVDLDDPLHASMLVTLPKLPVGMYVVRWRVVLVDGDSTEGTFDFYIGQAGSATAAAAGLSASSPPEKDSTSGVYRSLAGVSLVVWVVAGLGVSVCFIAMILGLRSMQKSKNQKL